MPAGSSSVAAFNVTSIGSRCGRLPVRNVLMERIFLNSAVRKHRTYAQMLSGSCISNLRFSVVSQTQVRATHEFQATPRHLAHLLMLLAFTLPF
jgi:hypothetical protein